MPHRRLVQIGGRTPPPPAEPLPTVWQYFKELADRQGEDIRLLKERARAFAELRTTRKAEAARRKSIREESWRLHPVVVPEPENKRAAKTKQSAAKTTKRNAKRKR